MRDRLVELLCNVKCEGEECFGNCPHRIGQQCAKVQRLEMCAVFAIADHLLSAGVIVPPCKVGDTVYVLSQGAGFSVVWRVYKATAKAIHLDQYGKLFVRAETDKDVGGYVEVERIFLTREEAEKALAERREG